MKSSKNKHKSGTISNEANIESKKDSAEEMKDQKQPIGISTKLEYKISEFGKEQTKIQAQMMELATIIQERLKINLSSIDGERRSTRRKLNLLRRESSKVLRHDTTFKLKPFAPPIDWNAINEKVVSIDDAITKRATNENVESIQRNLREILNTKCSNSQFKKFEATMQEIMKVEKERIDELIEAQEKFRIENTKITEKLSDDVVDNNEITKKSLELISKLKTTVDKLVPQPDEYVRGNEVLELKSTVTSYGLFKPIV